ncbi:MAG TPA: SDR family NAD(P)-dependent oxidoreductase [Dehalococcoidia bacterium]|nr:SDR family NAD(P)-dependent oxidoreductase [Dehalococcoidia bacterium]
MWEGTPLAGKVAVVTGASRGIGRATAIALARAGADVVLAARTAEEGQAKLPGSLRGTAQEVEALGRRALAVPTDLTRDEDVERLARRTLETFGRVDVLVNNAAVNYMAPFAETPMRRWDLVLDVNLRGTVLCTRLFLPHMLAQGQGTIVNLSSYLAVAHVPRTLAYGVSKMAIEKFSQGLAQELLGTGVSVNCLRIEANVATEGWTFLNPGADFSGWERPEGPAECIVWLATQPPSLTGLVLTLADVRRLRAQMP